MSQNDTDSKKNRSKISPPVFYTSALVIMVIVGFAAIMPEVAESHLSHLQQNLFNNASWFYILAVAIILLSVTYLGLSR